MQKVALHYSEKDLLSLSKNAPSARVALRILMIRDRLLGEDQATLSARYGMHRTRISVWIRRYNEAGVAGLEDKARSGAPLKIDREKLASFKRRIAAGPDPEKDKRVRWRAVDVQQLLQEEFGAPYKTVQGVRRLMHALGLSALSTRPSHPKRPAGSAEEFKKTPDRTAGHPGTASRQNRGAMVSG